MVSSVHDAVHMPSLADWLDQENPCYDEWICLCVQWCMYVCLRMHIFVYMCAHMCVFLNRLLPVHRDIVSTNYWSESHCLLTSLHVLLKHHCLLPVLLVSHVRPDSWVTECLRENSYGKCQSVYSQRQQGKHVAICPHTAGCRGSYTWWSIPGE